MTKLSISLEQHIDRKIWKILLLAAGGELIISDLNLYRFFLQYWRLIRNGPDALIFDFPTIMIATGLNVSESLYIYIMYK